MCKFWEIVPKTGSEVNKVQNTAKYHTVNWETASQRSKTGKLKSAREIATGSITIVVFKAAIF